MKKQAPTPILRPHDFRLVDRRMICADCDQSMTGASPSCPGLTSEKRRALADQLVQGLAGNGTREAKV